MTVDISVVLTIEVATILHTTFCTRFQPRKVLRGIRHAIKKCTRNQILLPPRGH